MTSTAVVENDGRTDLEKSVQTIQEACDRNIPLELHYINNNVSNQRVEPDILYAQTRMLGVDDTKIYLDAPQSIGKKVHLRIGWKVDAFFTYQNNLYTFRTAITDLNCLVELNQEKTVVGMCLATPMQIRVGQRREDHRINLVGLRPFPVDLHETNKEDPNACPITAKRFTGLGVNISRGGISIRMEGEQRFLPRFGQWFFLSFVLPDDTKPMFFLVELRNLREVEKSESRRFGFQFYRWPDSTRMREKQARLGRFLAAKERSTLRKKNEVVSQLFKPAKN
jgi:c-di-GMP-binding flagellar brake protein YcgR